MCTPSQMAGLLLVLPPPTCVTVIIFFTTLPEFFPGGKWKVLMNNTYCVELRIKWHFSAWHGIRLCYGLAITVVRALLPLLLLLGSPPNTPPKKL